MRQPSEDELEDYRQQDAEERYEKLQARQISTELQKERTDPGYVASWRE
jgi:hypothetical protein